MKYAVAALTQCSERVENRIAMLADEQKEFKALQEEWRVLDEKIREEADKATETVSSLLLEFFSLFLFFVLRESYFFLYRLFFLCLFSFVFNTPHSYIVLNPLDSLECWRKKFLNDEAHFTPYQENLFLCITFQRSATK